MISRQETARPLLTPGEVMQLPADDELVLVSGCPPIRAKKARYYEDRRLTERVLAPPKPEHSDPLISSDDWSHLPIPALPKEKRISSTEAQSVDDPANGGIRREPATAAHEGVVAAQ